MPENPVYSRDDGHFIYLATVELGLKQRFVVYFEGSISVVPATSRERRDFFMD